MSRIAISLELCFLRIPTKWTRRKDLMDGNYALVPEVGEGPAKPIEDAWSLRNEFLRMEHSEEAALKLLEKVGAWDVGESATWEGAKYIQGEVGYRYIINPLYPVPQSIENLWTEQERWIERLKSPAKLRAEFGPPPKDDARPGEHSMFAFNTHFANTLPTHLEWKPDPHALIQPITGRELLIATAWVDLVSGYEVQVCQNCGIPFTSQRKRMFCPPNRWDKPSSCAHAAAQRMYRRRKSEEKKQQRGKRRAKGKTSR